MIGEKVSGKRGIRAQKKKKVCLVIQKAEKGGITRAYAREVFMVMPVKNNYRHIWMRIATSSIDIDQ